MSEMYWPSAISFLIAIITGGGGLYQYPEIYFFLNIAFFPIATVLWLTAMGKFLWKNQQKIIIIMTIVFNVLFEIYFFYLLFTAPEMIGNLNSPVDVSYKTFVLLYIIAVVIMFILPGILFARKSFLSDDPEIKLKGKFLLIAFISRTISAGLDAAMDLDIIPLILIRILAITSAFVFYSGFILPPGIRDLFLRDKK